MNGITMFICENLNLDMFRIYDAFFDKNIGTSEGLCGFRDNALIVFFQILGIVTAPDAATTTT